VLLVGHGSSLPERAVLSWPCNFSLARTTQGFCRLEDEGSISMGPAFGAARAVDPACVGSVTRATTTSNAVVTALRAWAVADFASIQTGQQVVRAPQHPAADTHDSAGIPGALVNVIAEPWSWAPLSS